MRLVTSSEPVKGEPPPLRHFKAYLILGLIGVFGFNLFFFLGMASTSPVNGALIMALNPTGGFTAAMHHWMNAMGSITAHASPALVCAHTAARSP